MEPLEPKLEPNAKLKPEPEPKAEVEPKPKPEALTLENVSEYEPQTGGVKRETFPEVLKRCGTFPSDCIEAWIANGDTWRELWNPGAKEEAASGYYDLESMQRACGFTARALFDCRWPLTSKNQAKFQTLITGMTVLVFDSTKMISKPKSEWVVGLGFTKLGMVQFGLIQKNCLDLVGHASRPRISVGMFTCGEHGLPKLDPVPVGAFFRNSVIRPDVVAALTPVHTAYLIKMYFKGHVKLIERVTELYERYKSRDEFHGHGWLSKVGIAIDVINCPESALRPLPIYNEEDFIGEKDILSKDTAGMLLVMEHTPLPCIMREQYPGLSRDASFCASLLSPDRHDQIQEFITTVICATTVHESPLFPQIPLDLAMLILEFLKAADMVRTTSHFNVAAIRAMDRGPRVSFFTHERDIPKVVEV